MLNKGNDSFNQMLNRSISPYQIVKAVEKLERNKSSVVYLIASGYIASTLEIMLPLFLKSFNVIFGTGVIPTYWVNGILVTIYKKINTGQTILGNEAGFRKDQITLNHVFSLYSLIHLFKGKWEEVFMCIRRFQKGF